MIPEFFGTAGKLKWKTEKLEFIEVLKPTGCTKFNQKSM